VTPDLVRNLARYAALTGKKPEDLLLMFGAGNVSTQQALPDDAVSYLQSGAGQAYSGTIRGGRETIKQREANAVQQSADRRYGADVRADATTDAATIRANAPGKGGKGGKAEKTRELSTAQAKQLNDMITDSAAESKVPLTTQQRTQVMARIAERYAKGELLSNVSAEELSNMVEEVPGEKRPWYQKDVPSSKKFKAPALEGITAKPGTAAPAAPAKGEAPSVPRDKTQWKTGTTYMLANGKAAKYLGNGQWDVR
jgi:hypothetical protein